MKNKISGTRNGATYKLTIGEEKWKYNMVKTYEQLKTMMQHI